MRLIVILTAIMTQLLLTNVSFAETETYEDCRSTCAGDKALRDVDCPSPYDSSSAIQDRDQCLKNSQETYNSCITRCPLPPPPPPESNTSPMSY